MNQEKLRKEWREEIKKYPQMDALGSADWWLFKLQEHDRELWQKMEDMKPKENKTMTYGTYIAENYEEKIFTREIITKCQSLLALDEE